MHFTLCEELAELCYDRMESVKGIQAYLNTTEKYLDPTKTRVDLYLDEMATLISS